MSKEIEFVCRDNRIDGPQLQLHNRETLNPEGQYAMALIERWGLVAAEPDGEDSAGRAKLKLPDPDALVMRAFDMAQKAYEMARTRGLMVALPSYDEIREQAREERDRN